MSIQLRSILDDWGEYRHPQNPHIIIVDCRRKFLAAVRHPSRPTVILNVDDEQKAADRAVFRRLWNEWQAPRTQSDFRFSKVERRFTSRNLRAECSYKPAEEKLRELCNMFFTLNISAQEIVLQLMANWRLKERKHGPHKSPVLNRVFFSGGTVLPLNEGFLQVAEGDFLHMCSGQPHWPEDLTKENENLDRITIALSDMALSD